MSAYDSTGDDLLDNKGWEGVISRDEGPDAPTDDDLTTCPECGEGKMVPRVKRSLVSEFNPQRSECDACGYMESE